MRPATLTHRAAIPDLDQRGDYHPHTLLRLAQEAVERLQRDAGVLHEVTRSSRVSELRLLSHSSAGREDELEITADVDEVTKTSVTFAFAITAGGRQVADGLLRRVFDDDVDKDLIAHLGTALSPDSS